jgi:hypothetical protein
MEQSHYNPISLFLNLGNQKCIAYKDRVITGEAFKKANDAYKMFGITCPGIAKAIQVEFSCG